MVEEAWVAKVLLVLLPPWVRFVVPTLMRLEPTTLLGLVLEADSRLTFSTMDMEWSVFFFGRPWEASLVPPLEFAASELRM